MTTDREPIAIVGIGCRFPGGANDPASLWQLLCDEFDGIGPVPASRFDAEALYDSRPATPGRIMSTRGGFLPSIEDMDADFFHIAPREAERLDPQQRVLLETAWEALEDAGIPRERIAGGNTGVFVGMWTNEFESRMFGDRRDVDFHMTTGSGRYAASGRLSFFLDVLGPSLTVDTACSSSLVSVHLACQSLRNRECDLALAGGSNVILDPTVTIAYSQLRMMAPDGHCKFGDASADGYVRSEGAGLVAIKRLADAQRDGDHVYAVIRGSAITNDGASSGLLARPGRKGQEEMLRLAYEDAGVDPLSVQYIEAHGTGTAAGDPVELGALGAVIGVGRGHDDPCLVGSIKSNIGHAEGAAGIAGLIKLALSLDHGEIPASLHVSEPNPKVPWAQAGLRVCTERHPFDATNGPVIAGVTAFGIAGTNAHMVMESSAPRVEPTSPEKASDDAGAQLLMVSARSAGALRDLADSYRTVLAERPGQLTQICAAAATRRSHLEHRLAVTGTDASVMADALATFALDRQSSSPATGPATGPAARAVSGVVESQPASVVFVFPGQGAQWSGMANELLATEPIFRAAMERCDRAIQAEAGWSPLEMLAEADDHTLERIDIVQPLLFAIQTSLAAQWSAWGVVPTAVVGHSMGEVAAAHVAGALSLDDAVKVICLRSNLLRRVSGNGAMAVVDLSVDDTRAAIAGYEHELSIAVSNSPRSTVISGAPDAVASVMASLEGRDVFCRLVKVDVASHSPQMDPLIDELRSGLIDLHPECGSAIFHSTVDGSAVDGELLGPDYWARNLRMPVRFGDVVADLASRASTAFVEISPHPILLPAIEQVIASSDHDCMATESMRRGEPERSTMLAGLGALFVAGAVVDWTAFFGADVAAMRLPTYPWQRERYWHEPSRSDRAQPGAHPLLGRVFRPADRDDSIHWQTDLTGSDMAFLDGHVVNGEAVFPAAAFIEYAQAAAAELLGEGHGELTDLALIETLATNPEDARTVQIVVESRTDRSGGFRVYSQRPGGEATDQWRLHATGSVSRSPAHAETTAEPLAQIRERCREHRDADAHYAVMTSSGLDYSGAFRPVEECWLGNGEALGRLRARTGITDPSAGRVPLVDGCLQLAVALGLNEASGGTFLPTQIDSIDLVSSALVEDDVWAHVTVVSSDGGEVVCDITMLDSAGTPIVRGRGVHLQRVGAAHGVDSLFYEVGWRQTDQQISTHEPTNGTWVVYANDAVGQDLVARLSAAGATCITVTPGTSSQRIDATHYTIDPTSAQDHRAVLADAVQAGCERIVYAWGAGIPNDGEQVIQLSEELGCAGPIALVQALGQIFDIEDPVRSGPEPRLWIVTTGAQTVEAEGAVAARAVLWGVGRVVANERPAVRCTMIDLDHRARDAEHLLGELVGGNDDREIVLRGQQRSVARLQRVQLDEKPGLVRRADADSYRLVATEPGSLDTLGPRMQPRRVPKSGEIEVQIIAAGLNFLDVMKAMGICPGFEPSPEVALGAECAGVVVAVGPDVHDHAVGDQVIAITPSYWVTSMLAAYVTVPAAFAVKRPAHIAPAEAAAIPLAYLTAYTGLIELARLRKGESVLVHSATGGVGLAAIEICRHVGAHVLATAGSETKRDYLRSIGIEHVYDSRTIEFASQVREATGGRGVDVVLNSLVGEAIPAGLRSLATQGRFVEIGKRDVYSDTPLGLDPFKNNLSFFVLDLAGLTETNPQHVGDLYQTMMALVESGDLPSLPTTASPFTEAAEVFRTMARAEHIGKLVLIPPGTPIPADVPPIRSDSTYLITGGLGALGLEVARRFVERGARHLVLVGRSAPSARAQGVLDEFRAHGAQIEILNVDVADRRALSEALDSVRTSVPVLRGVVHAAGTLRDATIGQMDAERLHDSLQPKLAGGWNLHHTTLHDPLDFFVSFSSVAAVLGLSGQSNYAAGNAFLDALAHARRASGRPAMSIGWGPWSDIGLAAADTNRGDRLSARGLHGLTPRDGLDALERLLDQDRAHIAVMDFDGPLWLESVPATGMLADFAVDAEPGGDVAATLRTRLLDTPVGAQRRAAIEGAVCAQLAPVLRVAPERIDRRRPLEAMGVDSLMALEFRNRLESETGLKLSATLAFNYPTVALLAEHLAGRMDMPLDRSQEPGQPTSSEGTAEPVVAPEELSVDDVEALLESELAAVERLLDSDGGSA